MKKNIYTNKNSSFEEEEGGGFHTHSRFLILNSGKYRT